MLLRTDARKSGRREIVSRKKSCTVCISKMREICVALFFYLLPENYSSLKSALGFGFLFADL